jgi:glutaconate CoA-transferase subunit A
MKVIAKGEGRLFSDPDPDKARAFFRTKSREMSNKLTTVTEAVKKYFKPGMYAAIGGFGANRIPTAILHELLRQNIKGLAFAGHTSTHDFEILCAGECFDRCDVAYIVGLEARGLSPAARRYMESGRVECTEWTNYALALRLRAAAMGVSYCIGRNLLGTDTFKKSAAMVVECPFTGKIFCAFPALYPDVAAIHVHEADVYGNCRLKGISIADLELARASKRVIITCERLITNDEIRRDPTSTVIPFYLVDAVIEVPYGSYPGNMAYEYFSDEEHLRTWLKVEEDEAEFRKFLDKYVYGTKDFNEYLELCGGLKRIQDLRRMENLIPSPADSKGGK